MKEQRLILLVEDNDDDVELTLRALRRNRVANRVDVVRDGAEALEYLFATGSYAGRDVRDAPNLVLLDLKLPKVGGLEVLERLRADPRTTGCPWSSSRPRTSRATSRAATTSAPTATSASRWTSRSSWRPSTSWACTGSCSTRLHLTATSLVRDAAPVEVVRRRGVATPPRALSRSSQRPRDVESRHGRPASPRPSLPARRQQPRVPRVLRAARVHLHAGRAAHQRALRPQPDAAQDRLRVPARVHRLRLGRAREDLPRRALRPVQGPAPAHARGAVRAVGPPARAHGRASASPTSSSPATRPTTSSARSPRRPSARASGPSSSPATATPCRSSTRTSG